MRPSQHSAGLIDLIAHRRHQPHFPIARPHEAARLLCIVPGPRMHSAGPTTRKLARRIPDLTTEARPRSLSRTLSAPSEIGIYYFSRYKYAYRFSLTHPLTRVGIHAALQARPRTLRPTANFNSMRALLPPRQCRPGSASSNIPISPSYATLLPPPSAIHDAPSTFSLFHSCVRILNPPLGPISQAV